ncbi:MAG: DMT family transporter [Rikenellaceae bacterium]
MGSFVTLFWATVATAFKIALGEIGYIELLLIASITALFVCLIEVLRTGKLHLARSLFQSKKDLFKGAWQGFLNPFFYYLVLFKAYSLLPAQIAQPLNYSWQVVLILMMAIFFRQKLRLIQIFGVLVSFSGILLLSANSSADSSGSLSIPGILLALGSAFIWATYWISKLNNKADSVVELFLNFFFGSIYLIIISLFIPVEWPSAKALFAGIYVGCFEMGITFILWAKALQLATNRVTLAQITYLSPLLSLILIHFVLGEKIGYLTITGLLFVIGGILISNMKMGKLSKTQPSDLAN